MIVFMVRKGFGLVDLKKLYLDEFIQYYEELIYSLEQSKEIEDGSYDKVRGVDNTVEKLKKLFGTKR